MRDRGFVWTWWAGTVPDYFGTRSVFHVARFGVLRIRRAVASDALGGVARRGRREHAAAPLLLVRTRDCRPLGGLLIGGD